MLSIKVLALAAAGVLTSASLAGCGGDPTPPVGEPSATGHRWQARAGAAEHPASFTGRWLVHGGQLVINQDGTAHFSHVSPCPPAWGTASGCTQEVDFTWSETGDPLRLLVLDVWVTDGTRRRFPDPPPPMSAGSFYIMTLDADGSATTRLQNDDAAVAGANGLGNPHLCRPGSEALVNGVCGA